MAQAFAIVPDGGREIPALVRGLAEIEPRLRAGGIAVRGAAEQVFGCGRFAAPDGQQAELVPGLGVLRILRDGLAGAGLGFGAALGLVGAFGLLGVSASASANLRAISQ